MLAMIAGVTSGLLSMLQGALLAAGLMLLTRCTDGATARKAPDWQVLVVIATSFGIGAALQASGAAAVLANGLIGMADQDPHVALALVFVSTALLTAFATNNVAAVLAFPVLIVMLTGWIDAAGAAAAAAAALSKECETSPILRFDDDTFIDFRARRPVMELRDGINTDLVWNTIELRAGRSSSGRSATSSSRVSVAISAT